MKRMLSQSLPFAIAICVSASSAPARADQLCHTLAVPTTMTNYDIEVLVPRFDTAFGTLQSVGVTIDFQVVITTRFESLDPISYVVSVVQSASGEIYAPDGLPFVSDSPSSSSTHALSAFDGTFDFGGTSGITLPPLALANGPTAGTRNDSNVLTLYAGPPGNPGWSGTRARALGLTTANGAGNLITRFEHQASFASITVCYVYAPRVTTVCAGDGSASPCPCGNPGSTGAGCSNSFGFGSLLVAAGGAAVAADTLTFTATVPNSSSTLFFQGTQPANGGQGLSFGDGLRCAGGTVVRIGGGPGVAGLAQYPRPGDPPISVRGFVPSGATRYYQAWYRNVASFCTLATFNLSNGLRIDWGT